MKTNKQLILIFGVLILIAMLDSPETQNQTVIPECFEKADCWRPITEEYCNVEFDCIQGKCYTSDVLCPELCGTGEDEDKDGYIDCADDDCWDSIYCDCSIMNFNECVTGRCYCASGIPRWHITGGGNYCWCVG